MGTKVTFWPEELCAAERGFTQNSDSVDIVAEFATGIGFAGKVQDIDLIGELKY